MAAAGRRHVDVRAGAPAEQRLPDRSGDRDTAGVDVRLERADQLVLDRGAVTVADTDDAADSGAAVPGRRDDLGGCQLRLEQSDPPLQLRLLLEQVLQREVVGEVAVVPRLTQTVGELAPCLVAQAVELAVALRVAVRADQQGLVRVPRDVSRPAPFARRAG